MGAKSCGERERERQRLNCEYVLQMISKFRTHIATTTRVTAKRGKIANMRAESHLQHHSLFSHKS